MTQSDPSTVDLCPQCRSRPAVSQTDYTTSPPSTVRFCESCFTQLMESRFQTYIAKLGAELDVAFRQGGHPLPPGLSGEQMIRSLLDESRKETFSEAGRERQRTLTRITQEVAATLPGGSANPDFIALVSTRYKEWLDRSHDGAE